MSPTIWLMGPWSYRVLPLGNTAATTSGRPTRSTFSSSAGRKGACEHSAMKLSDNVAKSLAH